MLAGAGTRVGTGWEKVGYKGLYSSDGGLGGLEKRGASGGTGLLCGTLSFPVIRESILITSVMKQEKEVRKLLKRHSEQTIWWLHSFSSSLDLVSLFTPSFYSSSSPSVSLFLKGGIPLQLQYSSREGLTDV